MAGDPVLLRRLVDEAEIDQLFSLASIEDMAQAWIAEHRRQRPPEEDVADDSPHWWAMELWWTPEWLSDTERVRAGLLALVDAADTFYELRLIGAAPLENFVSDDADDLEWLEAQCAGNPKLRTALAGVWCSDFVRAETLARLDRAAGVPLDRAGSSLSEASKPLDFRRS